MKDFNTYITERLHGRELEEHVNKRADYLEKIVNSADRQPDNYDDTGDWKLAYDDFEPFDTTYGTDIDWYGSVEHIIENTAIAYWQWDGKNCPSEYIAELMKKAEKERIFYSCGYFVDRYFIKDEDWGINIIDATVSEDFERYLFFSIDDNYVIRR